MGWRRVSLTSPAADDDMCLFTCWRLFTLSVFLGKASIQVFYLFFEWDFQFHIEF